MDYRDLLAERQAELERAETRLAETLARLEELRAFAQETAAIARRTNNAMLDAKAKTHNLYVEELTHIIAQARR